MRFGSTVGCHGCIAINRGDAHRPHTEECRIRIEGELRRTKSKKIEKADKKYEEALEEEMIKSDEKAKKRKTEENKDKVPEETINLENAPGHETDKIEEETQDKSSSSDGKDYAKRRKGGEDDDDDITDDSEPEMKRKREADVQRLKRVREEQMTEEDYEEQPEHKSRQLESEDADTKDADGDEAVMIMHRMIGNLDAAEWTANGTEGS